MENRRQETGNWSIDRFFREWLSLSVIPSHRASAARNLLQQRQGKHCQIPRSARDDIERNHQTDPLPFSISRFRFPVLHFFPFGIVLLCLMVQGCSTLARPAQLATSLDTLVPHGDRDHFVFKWERLIDGVAVASGLQVEHVGALAAAGEFEVTLSEDGLASGRVRIRSDGKSMVVVSEDDLTRGVRITYKPPLPYVDVPLNSGQRQATVDANVTGIDDDQALGVLKVTQHQEFAAAAPTQSALGSHPNPISVRTTRRLEGGGETIEITTQLLLVPGLGELRSESTAMQAPRLRRELACAIVGGRAIGDCQKLKLRGRE